MAAFFMACHETGYFRFFFMHKLTGAFLFGKMTVWFLLRFFLFPRTIPHRTFTILADIPIQANHKLTGELRTQANKFYVISVANRCVKMGEAAGIDV